MTIILDEAFSSILFGNKKDGGGLFGDGQTDVAFGELHINKSFQLFSLQIREQNHLAFLRLKIRMKVYFVIPRLMHWHALALNFTEDILEIPKLRRNIFFHVTLILLLTNMNTRWGVDTFAKETWPVVACMRTMTHVNWSSPSINLSVMSLQPIISQDDQ